jgi:hypothetical protein
MIGESESSAACRARSQQTHGHGCFSNASDGAMDQTAGDGEVGRFAGRRQRISRALLAAWGSSFTQFQTDQLTFSIPFQLEIDEPTFHKNPSNPLANFVAPSSFQGKGGNCSLRPYRCTTKPINLKKPKRLIIWDGRSAWDHSFFGIKEKWKHFERWKRFTHTCIRIMTVLLGMLSSKMFLNSKPILV